MNAKPVIFISAVSRELCSARDLVAKTLLALGYEPKWQDIAATDAGDLRGVLRKWVDDSDAVLQIVGHCYGFGRQTPDPDFGPCSYTQYEALYARQQGKKVWYIITDDDHPTDGCGCEPTPLRELQEKYRQTVKGYGDLYHCTSSLTQTELLVRRLKDDLGKLRAEGQKQHRSLSQRLALVLVLLLALVFGILWVKRDLWQQIRDSAETKVVVGKLQDQSAMTDQKVDTIIQHYKQMEQALNKLGGAVVHARQFSENMTPDQLRQRAYTILENELGIAAGTLAKELPGFALELYNRPDTSLLMRARAAYALNKFEEAEKLFLESDTQDKKAMENAEKIAAKLRGQRIEALEGAGLSALSQVLYASALEYFRAAAALTSRERDPLEWADVQAVIAEVLGDLLKSNEEEQVLREVIQVRKYILGREDPATLSCRMNLAIALNHQGKYGEAEQENRDTLAIQERVVGRDHEDTLLTRINLANTLRDQGKYDEAVQEYRATLPAMERVIGMEDRLTLASRNNLAAALGAQGKYEEAVQENRAVLAILERTVGTEHVESLEARNDLAVALYRLGDCAMAEHEHRAVLAIRERVLGAEHPKTLESRNNLFATLEAQDKHAEAEKEQRTVLAIRARVLGAEHPKTLESRNNLAATLISQKKNNEAETELRKLLPIEQRVLGSENPITLKSLANLASALIYQGKYVEAEPELRTSLASSERVLGAEHPEVLQRRTLLAVAQYSQAKYGEAEETYRRVLALNEKVHGTDHLDVFAYCFNLALCLAYQGKLKEALTYAERAEKGWKKVLGLENPNSKRGQQTRERIEAALKARDLPTGLSPPPK